VQNGFTTINQRRGTGAETTRLHLPIVQQPEERLSGIQDICQEAEARN